MKYEGRYVQIFRSVDGKVKPFEEYYNTAQLTTPTGDDSNPKKGQR